MKIDWTKPVRLLSWEAHYVGRSPSQRQPHVVARVSSKGCCDLHSVDDFGRDRNGAQIVANAPEPKRVYSGLWVNVYRDDNGGLSPGLHFYTSPQEAGKGTSCSRIACIRLPDFTEGEGLE